LRLKDTMANSIIVLTNRPELSYTGEKVKGDGYYGNADGLHTMSFHVKSFTGRVYLEATIVDEPTESDWFNIGLTQEEDYYEFDGQTATVGTTFQGNFVYLRVLVDRSYLGDDEYSVDQHGIFDKAVLLI
jgi:hypothetical protein